MHGLNYSVLKPKLGDEDSNKELFGSCVHLSELLFDRHDCGVPCHRFGVPPNDCRIYFWICESVHCFAETILRVASQVCSHTITGDFNVTVHRNKSSVSVQCIDSNVSLGEFPLIRSINDVRPKCVHII